MLHPDRVRRRGALHDAVQVLEIGARAVLGGTPDRPKPLDGRASGLVADAHRAESGEHGDHVAALSRGSTQSKWMPGSSTAATIGPLRQDPHRLAHQFVRHQRGRRTRNAPPGRPGPQNRASLPPPASRLQIRLTASARAGRRRLPLPPWEQAGTSRSSRSAPASPAGASSQRNAPDRRREDLLAPRRSQAPSAPSRCPVKGAAAVRQPSRSRR